MIFVDTNYFLRFLISDSSKQFIAVKEFFLLAARGEIQLITNTIVFFEIYWVLVSYYNKNKFEVASLLQKILDLSFILFEEKEILQNSLDRFQNCNLSLEDCYNLSFAQNKGIKDFKTFDLKLLKELKKTN